MDFPAAARRLPSDVVLIGNISPTEVMVSKSPQQVYADTRALAEAMNPYHNFVLSTGCDLPPETPLANIQAFMDAGRGRPLTADSDQSTEAMLAITKERPETIMSIIESAWARESGN